MSLFAVLLTTAMNLNTILPKPQVIHVENQVSHLSPPPINFTHEEISVDGETLILDFDGNKMTMIKEGNNEPPKKHWIIKISEYVILIYNKGLSSLIKVVEGPKNYWDSIFGFKPPEPPSRNGDGGGGEGDSGEWWPEYIQNTKDYHVENDVLRREPFMVKIAPLTYLTYHKGKIRIRHLPSKRAKDLEYLFDIKTEEGDEHQNN